MQDVDGVPLPATAKDAAGQGLAGAWFGTWGGLMKHILVLGPSTPDGTSPSVYAYGDNPTFGIKRDFFESTAEVTEERAIVKGRAFTATYDLTPTGRLLALYVGNNGIGTALLSRQTFPESGEPASWTFGEQVFVKAQIDGEPVPMDTVIYKPDGPGPFPLAVVSHGSTGQGTDRDAFGETWSSDELADYLVARGWMVALPHRRGRGRTPGLYDEGFAPDRSKGYTCDVDITTAGFDRAIGDLNAAITALKARPDVQSGPVLLAGQSRGGTLSVAYAGRYPDQVQGVVNFVGGWLGEGCSTASQVNQALMAEGAGFSRPMIWVYGDQDVYYSLDHSRANFDAFRRAGGLGEFLSVNVPGQKSGHAAIGIPGLWAGQVGAYLDQIEQP